MRDSTDIGMVGCQEVQVSRVWSLDMRSEVLRHNTRE